ncbi:MAG: SRPBCC domain-containing protein [Ignavibacteriaceae bacterium]|jgi:activator of HSP90 ATPase
MIESIKISEVFPVSAKRLYDAWLNSEEHSEFTGSKAEIRPTVGSRFSAWDGYITGTNITLQPYGRIVQNWRATDFPKGAMESKLEILFEKTNSGTRVTLIHTKLPSAKIKDYEKGWVEHYFKPMKKYFKKIKHLATSS